MERGNETWRQTARRDDSRRIAIDRVRNRDEGRTKSKIGVRRETVGRAGAGCIGKLSGVVQDCGWIGSLSTEKDQ